MRIVLTGGGTGGHIYPALALWRYVSERHPEAEFLYIGGTQGLERDIVTRAGLPFVAVQAAGLKRQLSLSALRTAFLTFRGYLSARRQIARFRPDVVVGTGGYVTLPVVLAAHARRVPVVVWEANARPGLTNTLAARRAYAVAVSFADSARYFPAGTKVVFTGNPRGSEVLEVAPDAVAAAKAAYHIDPARKLVLCYMGSRGSQTVNQVMTALIPRFMESDKWQLLYVTGEAHHAAVLNQVQAITGAKTLPSHVQIVPFIHDMPNLLPAADVVVTRAGGATLSEICSLGLPSILIPSPYVTANHQEENAKRMVHHGAARMLREADLTPDALWDALTRILADGQAAAMRDAARRIATPNAVADLYQLVLEAKDQGAKQ
ncbi:undecaprenyldiphospho-muramoylpentapeptide beta-N-acetylglucosaminyltransferase [Alicyclobacillus cycloheptanicus]|uniref:UDP-N-acetylglucosamine--N-acetylmuramyl-(pentapeptide) pyrophosphoryl-undecaprenol N-acetylglucosamine transferase n=1 Tax=Alicyclobacillus cycloheptanicus TaxID=1457 RepID=A0ABT9XLH8_9BACL|nr:undecaprenyldiphospho-muramoylpentapeptide beta-N-acetylglucosaminyltransferase [Alicyclobacillus cycloheptanicus]MDQ0190970.1 UDP-N-acetylglucosamine--N-acetylmuramyl-(pentapeptide) pyrophosphoryl-undecaprenol N-acetylglucosamine transferase [Alicyclobacillus cycloheptanicus]WDM01500.1 undecaprenyldiphospho-muramoylpentapeptide beta-N-acetylglucosaminyltransferase [Alicyclobacillus cycloheptanicus]